MADIKKQIEDRLDKVKNPKVKKYVNEGLLKKIDTAGDAAAFWLERVEKDFKKLKAEGLMEGFEQNDFADLWFVLTGEKGKKAAQNEDIGGGDMSRFKDMAEKIAGVEKRAGRAAPKGMLLIELSAMPNLDFRPGTWQAEVDIKPMWKVVYSLAEAQKAARNFIEVNDLGGGNWTGGAIFDDTGSNIARVSYNGRVWEPGHDIYGPEIDVRKFDKGRIGAVVEKIDERTQIELMRRVSAALGYRLDSMPLRSTIGTGWTMTNQRDYLEIQVHFNLNGSASLAVLSLDLNSQEDIGSKEVTDGGDVMALIRAAKELRAKVVGSELVEHLRHEQGLNASRRSSMKKKGCDTCGCGVIADSLIAPMSAEEKDAEAGPKEGPVMMTQPLRARRDYGAVASRVADSVMYDSVNDAADVTGDRGYERQGGSTELWYMKPQFSKDGFMGFEWLKERGMLPDPTELSATHIHLGRIREGNLGRVFRMMQGEVWSPRGQANSLIRNLGLHHTSMSVGDVVEVRGKAYLVDSVGFEELPPVRRV